MTEQEKVITSVAIEEILNNSDVSVNQSQLNMITLELYEHFSMYFNFPIKMNPENTLTDLEIDIAFEGKGYNKDIQQRKVVNQSLIWCALGYPTTISVLLDLQLVGIDRKLTQLDREYLKSIFSHIGFNIED